MAEPPTTSPREYGDRHAAVYDRIYGARFAAEPVAAALADPAGDGQVLELGLGTGRWAIPLAAREYRRRRNRSQPGHDRTATQRAGRRTDRDGRALHHWTGTQASAASRDPISIYRHPKHDTVDRDD